jgi:hypothetical protein
LASGEATGGTCGNVEGINKLVEFEKLMNKSRNIRKTKTIRIASQYKKYEKLEN